MATKKTPKVINTEGRVELYIEPTDANDDPNELNSVNGKNYVIPKGEYVWVPPEVMAEYKRSRNAKKRFNQLVVERTAKA